MNRSVNASHLGVPGISYYSVLGDSLLQHLYSCCYLELQIQVSDFCLNFDSNQCLLFIGICYVLYFVLIHFGTIVQPHLS